MFQSVPRDRSDHPSKGKQHEAIVGEGSVHVSQVVRWSDRFFVSFSLPPCVSCPNEFVANQRASACFCAEMACTKSMHIGPIGSHRTGPLCTDKGVFAKTLCNRHGRCGLSSLPSNIINNNNSNRFKAWILDDTTRFVRSTNPRCLRYILYRNQVED